MAGFDIGLAKISIFLSKLGVWVARGRLKTYTKTLIKSEKKSS
jgi:hypothetical protein